MLGCAAHWLAFSSLVGSRAYKRPKTPARSAKRPISLQATLSAITASGSRSSDWHTKRKKGQTIGKGNEEGGGDKQQRQKQ